MTNLRMATRIATSLAALGIIRDVTRSLLKPTRWRRLKPSTMRSPKLLRHATFPRSSALYEDDAVLIWPGQGEFAIGKPAIEKVIQAYCSGTVEAVDQGHQQRRAPVGLDYIIHFGQLDTTAAGPDGKPVTVRIRTSELLHKSHGKWRYEVDHASAGLPPPPGAMPAKPRSAARAARDGEKRGIRSGSGAISRSCRAANSSFALADGLGWRAGVVIVSLTVGTCAYHFSRACLAGCFP